MRGVPPSLSPKYRFSVFCCGCSGPKGGRPMRATSDQKSTDASRCVRTRHSVEIMRLAARALHAAVLRNAADAHDRRPALRARGLWWHKLFHLPLPDVTLLFVERSANQEDFFVRSLVGGGIALRLDLRNGIVGRTGTPEL